jgi:hypothetical protein
MDFDQVTHDFVLSVKKELEAAETQRIFEEKEIVKREKEVLKKWAIGNGDEFLKLKIKHDQNWFKEACYQFAKLFALPGFAVSEGIENED